MAGTAQDAAVQVMESLSVVMAIAMVMKITTHVQKIVMLLVIVTMEIL
jgi:hypothetical protein